MIRWNCKWWGNLKDKPFPLLAGTRNQAIPQLTYRAWGCVVGRCFIGVIVQCKTLGGVDINALGGGIADQQEKADD